MKRFLRPVLCGGVLAALLCTPSLAAGQGETVPLLLNGESVVFPDALPVLDLNQEEVYLPAVATLEALGYEISWDADSQTITAEKEDSVLSLTIGSTTAAGAEGTVSLSQVPHVDPTVWRTYLSLDDLLQLLGGGYRAGVDYGWTVDSGGGLVLSGAESAAILDHVDAIWAANTETYALMDQYMEYARTYNEGSYKVDGSYQMSISSVSEGVYDPVDGDSYPVITQQEDTIEGDYSMVTDQTALQFATTLSIGGTLEGQPIAPTEIAVDMRCDVNDGTFYFWFQSENLKQVLGTELPDQWYSLDLKEMYDDIYGPGSYAELLALNEAGMEAPFRETLEELLYNPMLSLSQETTTADYLEVFNALFGDSSFEKSGNTYVNTWAMDDASSIRWILYTDGRQINGYGLEFVVEDAGGDMTMNMEMREDTMTFQLQALGLSMEMDGTYQPSSSAPETEPPAGATVVDLMEMLTSMVEPVSPAEAG